jgi:ribonuclease T2
LRCACIFPGLRSTQIKTRAAASRITGKCRIESFRIIEGIHPRYSDYVVRDHVAKLRTSLACFITLALAAGLTAQFRARPRPEAPAPAPFDYYILSLSWAPAFCAQLGAAAGNPKECASGSRVGFIVHGLWPEAAAGTSPESCGKTKPVPKPIVDFVLRDMLSPGLIQHEWATHGSCTGLSPFDYFSLIVQARASVQIPVQITSIEDQVRESPGQIETQFAAANPSFPRTAFRTSCPTGAFQEERICYDKSLKPQACTGSAGECTLPAISIRPILP